MAAGLTKTQLVRQLAEKLETPNKTAAAFLENLADTACLGIQKHLGQGNGQPTRRSVTATREQCSGVRLLHRPGRPGGTRDSGAARAGALIARCRGDVQP